MRRHLRRPGLREQAEHPPQGAVEARRTLFRNSFRRWSGNEISNRGLDSAPEPSSPDGILMQALQKAALRPGAVVPGTQDAVAELDRPVFWGAGKDRDWCAGGWADGFTVSRISHRFHIPHTFLNLCFQRFFIWPC